MISYYGMMIYLGLCGLGFIGCVLFSLYALITVKKERFITFLQAFTGSIFIWGVLVVQIGLPVALFLAILKYCFGM